MRRRRRRALFLGAMAFGLLVLFFLFDFEPDFAPVPTGIEVSERARALHREAFVVDLHADSLLWPRDLTRERVGGQLDLPRMREGGLDAVALTIATRFFGVGGLKAFHDRWPASTWLSPFERLKFQIGKAASLGRSIHLVTDAASLRRNHEDGVLSYFHGIEGAHALGDDPTRVARLKARGVLFIGVVHLSKNAYGGSSLFGGGGLTELGRSLIGEMNREGVLVDLAHASDAAFSEALELAELPPLVSHGGARAVHDSWRNLSDAQIRAVAEKGGVIGVMLGPPALSAPSLDEWLRHVAHIVEVGGEDAAAIGSDFDGFIEPPIDVSGLPQLTELMLRRGWSETRIRKILGENVLRVLGGSSDP